MPTAAKLFSAFAFALVAFFAANGVVPGLPEGTRLGLFIPLSLSVGAVCGWFVMGRAAGRGYQIAAGSGLRTSAMLAFWCVMLFSARLMLQNSIQRRYDGPMQAVTDTFSIALEYAQLLLRPDVLAILVVGGMLGGTFVEWASRRWN